MHMFFEKENLFKAVFFTNTFLVFWYFSNSIVGSISPVTSLLLILSLLTFVPVVKGANVFWESQKWWVVSLIIFGAFNIISLWVEGVEMSDDYDKPAKALGASLIFLYLIHYGFSHKFVGFAVAVATLVAGGYAIYEYFVLGFARAGTMTHPIRYGYLVVTLGLLCFFYAHYSNGRFLQVLYVVAGCVGLLGAYSTGTRGVVVILAFLVLFFLFSLFKYKQISWKKSGLFLGSFIAGVIFLSLNTNVLKSYIDKTLEEFEKIESGNMNTSIGHRFQMWHTALYLGVNEPIAGVGHDYVKIRERASEFIEVNGYNPDILVRYGHFHNQYLDSFAKQGVPGVLVWCMLLLGALLGMKTKYRYAVLIIVATLAVGGLTEAVLRSSRLFYLAVLGISIFRCLDYFEASGRFTPQISGAQEKPNPV